LVLLKCSSEIEAVCPIDASALVVSAWLDPQHDAWTISHLGDRDQETSIELQAIGGDYVDLVSGVCPAAETFGSAS
jgi:hypothetical protein